MHSDESRIKTFSAGGWGALRVETEGHFSSVWMAGDRIGVKEAASRVFPKKDLEELKPPPGYFGVHRTVMGDEEGFGFNINGDGYPGKMLERDHPTFVTHGHVYEEHRNKDPKKALGRIVAARYSPSSHRVETVEHVEIKKAGKYYDMARAGKELHASQSCKIPYDECSACGNKAAKAHEYCDDIRFNLKRWVPERRKFAFMRNNFCKFFDSSIVEVPADVTAKPHQYWFNDQDTMRKAASAFGDESLKIAGGMPLTFEETCALRLCAQLEDPTMPDPFRDNVSKYANVPFSVPHHEIKDLRRLMPNTLFRKLASQRILLPFSTFASYILDTPESELQNSQEFQKSAASLPGIFRALADALDHPEHGCLHESLGLIRPCSEREARCDREYDDGIDRIIQNMAEEAGFAPEPVQRRTVRVVIMSKRASLNPAFVVPPPSSLPPLVQLYGAYKVASIAAMNLTPFEQSQMAAHAVMQNVAFAS